MSKVIYRYQRFAQDCEFPIGFRSGSREHIGKYVPAEVLDAVDRNGEQQLESGFDHYVIVDRIICR